MSKLNEFELSPEPGDETPERVQNAKQRRDAAFAEFTQKQGLAFVGDVGNNVAAISQLEDCVFKVTKAGTLLCFDKKNQPLDPLDKIKSFHERHPEWRVDSISNLELEAEKKDQKDQRRDSDGKFSRDPNNVANVKSVDDIVRFNEKKMAWEPVVDVRLLSNEQRSMFFAAGINVEWGDLVYQSSQGKFAGYTFKVAKDAAEKMTGSQYKALSREDQNTVIKAVGADGIAKITTRRDDGTNVFAPKTNPNPIPPGIDSWTKWYLDKNYDPEVAKKRGAIDKARGRRLPGS
jgi:hypothetical protein